MIQKQRIDNFWLKLILLTIGYGLCHWLFFKALYTDLGLSEHWFQDGFIPKQLFEKPIPALLWVILSLLPFIFFRRTSWSKLLPSSSWRLLIGLAVIILLWHSAFSEYNYYFDQGFWIDRSILLILGVLSLIHPAFLFAFLGYLSIYNAQFLAPFLWPYIHHSQVLIASLIVFAVWNFIRLLGPRYDQIPILFLFCIHLGNYFYSAIAKIKMSPNGHEWVSGNELAMLPRNAHLRGWLVDQEWLFLGLERLAELAGKPIQCSIMILELAVLAFFFKRKWGIFFLISLTVMHLAISSFTGVIFWIWICFNLIGILILWKGGRNIESLFNKRNGLVAVVLIPLTLVFSQPSFLGWFDSRFQWYFELEVETDDGQRHYVQKREMDPYAYPFVHDIFNLCLDKKIPGFNGYSSLNYKEILAWRKADQTTVNQYVELHGKNHYHPRYKDRFDNFLRVYFSNRNRSGADHTFLNHIKPPDQLFMYRKPGEEFQFDQRVKMVRYYWKSYLWSEGSYHHLETILVSQVPTESD